MTDDFGEGLKVPEQLTQYRVTGGGKVATMWARDKNHARDKFATEFYPGVVAETCKQL